MALSFFKRFYKYLYLILSILSIFGVIETLLVKGFFFDEPDNIQSITLISNTAVIILYLLWVAGKVFLTGWNVRKLLPDLIISGFLLGMVFPLRVGGSVVSFRIVLSLVSTIFRKTGTSALFANIRLNPARVLLLSFLGVIVSGVVLLMLPAATVDQRGASFVDAVFTSTSATCVTGLIVQDTGSYFSLFGQIVILILIQAGGLGIMTFSTLFAMILGRRIGLKQEEHLRGILDQRSYVDTYSLIFQIIRITLVFEFSGTVFLFIKLIPELGSHRALYNAVFHSISAFCNAGFSLYSDSLIHYAGDIYINIVFITLIIFGGLGFVVINELQQNIQNLNPFTVKWSWLSVHSKLVILTTAGLLVAGTLTVFFFEFDNSMINLSTVDKLIAAFFQSVTFRTAGFNTVDISSLRDVTLFIGILLMFIGASPSSTGGGIKTTTFAVLILSVRSLLFSRDKVEAWKRTIIPQTVYKSVAILLFSFTFLILFSVILLETQEGNFLDILFEAASAMGTVGLSTGVTNILDGTGKILVSLLMYIGRIGPLTVALALGEVKKVNIEFPTTRISVG